MFSKLSFLLAASIQYPNSGITTGLHCGQLFGIPRTFRGVFSIKLSSIYSASERSVGGMQFEGVIQHASLIHVEFGLVRIVLSLFNNNYGI
jgi:hypothetical protein